MRHRSTASQLGGGGESPRGVQTMNITGGLGAVIRQTLEGGTDTEVGEEFEKPGQREGPLPSVQFVSQDMEEGRVLKMAHLRACEKSLSAGRAGQRGMERRGK